MPRANFKYYAVRVGREGPIVYDSQAEYHAATHQYSGATGKGFSTLRAAQRWLEQWKSRYDTAQHRKKTTTVPYYYDLTAPLSGDSYHEISNNRIKQETRNVATRTRGPFAINDLPVRHAQSTTKVVDFGEKAQAPALPPPNITLSSEQKRVLELVKTGRNVFFTGPAGTGKSVLLREIIKYAKASRREIAITAPTGIAGLNIGGGTIHSFAGIGLGRENVQHLVKRLSHHAEDRWKATSMLIIDEISMLDGRLFDKIEEMARIIRDMDEPFGGIQLVLSGDFFQLPPVPDSDSTTRIASTFAFEAKSWLRCVGPPVFLETVFRQKDTSFVSMLSALRLGVLSEEQISRFLALQRDIKADDGIEPTELYPLKREVNKCNQERLARLESAEAEFEAMETRGSNIFGQPISAYAAEALLEQLTVPRKLKLKVGAQVVLLRNITQGPTRLVNGSLGKVVDFINTGEALKKHLEIAEPDPRRDGDEMSSEVPSRGTFFPLNEGVVFKKNEQYPLVKFSSGTTLLCIPLQFEVQGLKGNTEATRTQVPLALAWAMSIHKSQGQTLPRVKVDVRRAFEPGQVYVALSRATSLEGLQVLNFDPVKARAHERVLRWTAEVNNFHEQEEEMDCDEAISQYHSLFDADVNAAY